MCACMHVRKVHLHNRTAINYPGRHSHGPMACFSVAAGMVPPRQGRKHHVPCPPRKNNNKQENPARKRKRNPVCLSCQNGGTPRVDTFPPAPCVFVMLPTGAISSATGAVSLVRGPVAGMRGELGEAHLSVSVCVRARGACVCVRVRVCVRVCACVCVCVCVRMRGKR